MISTNEYPKLKEYAQKVEEDVKENRETGLNNSTTNLHKT